jgi:phospholipid/cholesterol/gamma-HCH transport system permease protein
MSLQTLLLKPVKGLDDGLTSLGRQMKFYGRSIGWTGRTERRYKKEVVRLLAEVSLGTGALAVIGGTVGVIGFLAFFTGTEVGLQGYSALNQLGSAAFTGFVSAYFNTREIAPLVAGLALAATVGCGFTAQLGAMRISEEVDALEVMGIPSLPFLVTTRMIAGFIAVIPLYVVGLLSSYWATRLIATGYYGYTASGGPAGVGMAVGKAVRMSIVAINLVDFFLSLAIWGATTTVRIAG